MIMINCVKIIFGANLIIFAVLAEIVTEGEQNDYSQNHITRGEVQSCRGCSLNRLPDVKNFIYTDLPKYSGVEFHPIPGAVPHLVLFDASDKELDRIDLSSLSREQCNKLVQKWFKHKEEEIEITKEDVRVEL